MIRLSGVLARAVEELDARYLSRTWRIPLEHADALREERISVLQQALAAEECRERRVALWNEMRAEIRARSLKAVAAIEAARGVA